VVVPGIWGLGFGIFDKLRDSLTRTKEQIVSRFEEIVQQADAGEQRSRRSTWTPSKRSRSC